MSVYISKAFLHICTEYYYTYFLISCCHISYQKKIFFLEIFRQRKGLSPSFENLN